MTALAIILIISNLLFSLSVALIFICAFVCSKNEGKKDKKKSDELYRAFRTKDAELLLVLQRSKVSYQGKVFDVVGVYTIDNGETKLRLKNNLEFTLSVSIKDVIISDKNK